MRLKLASVRSFGAELIVKLRGVTPQSPLARVASRVIELWAVRKGVVFERPDSKGLQFEDAGAEPNAAWVQYLLAFDVKYRLRRLHFLIEGQNRLYLLMDQRRLPGFDPRVVDRLKRQLYERLEALRRREDPKFYSATVRDLVADIFPASVSGDEIKHVDGYAQRFVAERGSDIDRLIDRLAGEIDLNASTRDLDELLASLDPSEWHPEARREVLIELSGFSVLGRSHPSHHQRARDRRAPGDTDRSNKPGRCSYLQWPRRRHRLERDRPWTFRRLSFPRLPRKRLSSWPAACARPAH